MRKLMLSIIIVIGFSFATISCKKNNELGMNDAKEVAYSYSEIPFDSTLIKTFFVNHPKLIKYQPEVVKLYQKREYNYIWYDSKGITELGDLLYNKISNLEEEGVQVVVPYKEVLDEVFQNPSEVDKQDVNTELLLSSLYFFYAEKVFIGIDVKKTKDLGWYLPRKKQNYGIYLDSLLSNPSMINKNEKSLISQYYKLKEVLQKYKQIEKKGGWNKVVLDPKVKSIKVGDSLGTVSQIRTRLFANGDIQVDSKSGIYDEELAAGILKYKSRFGFKADKTITAKHIEAMNIPIADRIKTLMVNMERCRWIPTDISKSNELIVINIPSYRLTYFKDGKPALISNVVVGKDLNQTVVFSGMMSSIVFSPYWNVPKSILKKEILPAIAKNKNYLEQHDMEWYKGDVRQRPGPKNSLGLVKFLFPNSNAIYLHDTPSKNLFNEEKRAFSHGCIRVAKPIELANLILKDDSNWTPEKIDEAMHSGQEKWHTLKNKIPVYIGYFTSWVDAEGEIHFYDDVYKRDNRLAALIFAK